jgi:hypothetical protein
VRRPRIFISAVLHETILALVIVAAGIMSSTVEASPVPVRFPEGITHGFLVVRSLTGETIGHGEIVQVVKPGDLVESRLVFRFKDGSLHDERVAFSQQRVFTLVSYHLLQQGPSFPEQIDASIDRGTAEYQVRSRTGKESKEQVHRGQFALPDDVYNGMLVTVLMNLERGADVTVRILSFTPTPEVIPLRLLASGERMVQIGDTSARAMQYVFTPQIGAIRKVIGKALGKLPANFHYDCWMLAHDVPSFLQFEGPLQLMGPILRIELMSPHVTVLPAEKSPTR